MKPSTLETLKEILSAISIWVISWGIWWWLMHLYYFTKGESFKISVFVISTAIWGFVWYIAWEITSSSAISWICWAISMKIFEIFSEHWSVLLRKYIEDKYNITIWNEKD